jgi:hypothetical protein
MAEYRPDQPGFLLASWVDKRLSQDGADTHFTAKKFPKKAGYSVGRG